MDAKENEQERVEADQEGGDQDGPRAGPEDSPDVAGDRHHDGGAGEKVRGDEADVLG